MVLQPAALRAQLAALEKSIPQGEAPVVAFRGDPVWDAPETLRVEDRTWRVRTCRSSLEVREALAFREADALPLVILTNVPHHDLGADVLARLVKRRLLDLDTWEPVLRAFGAQRLDARLAREPWLADVLLAGMRPGGYPKIASGTLDATTAWREAIGYLLGVPCDALDTARVLEWTLDSSFLARWKTLTDPQTASIRQWVADSAGAGADLAVALVVNQHGADALALAAVAKLLFREDPPTGSPGCSGGSVRAVRRCRQGVAVGRSKPRHGRGCRIGPARRSRRPASGSGSQPRR